MTTLDHRRAAVRRFRAAWLAPVLCAVIAGCGDLDWHSIDVSGSAAPLGFTMTRASDGRTVTQADYRGRVVLLYFGYTYCPDACPLTLTNVGHVLQRLGSDADKVRVLFVTVDPDRDSAAVLAAYVAKFAPQIVGLRGTADQLAALARRYRIVYSVTPATKDRPYVVTHSSVIYAFDGGGDARLLIPSLATDAPDVDGTTADLRRLIEEQRVPGFLMRLWRRV